MIFFMKCFSSFLSFLWSLNVNIWSITHLSVFPLTIFCPLYYLSFFNFLFFFLNASILEDVVILVLYIKGTLILEILVLLMILGLIKPTPIKGSTTLGLCTQPKLDWTSITIILIRLLPSFPFLLLLLQKSQIAQKVNTKLHQANWRTFRSTKEKLI